MYYVSQSPVPVQYAEPTCFLQIYRYHLFGKQNYNVVYSKDFFSDIASQIKYIYIS